MTASEPASGALPQQLGDGGWTLDLRRWRPRDITATGVVLLQSADGRAWCAWSEQRPGSVLMQRLQALVQSPVAWLACSADAWRDALAQADYRALEPTQADDSAWTADNADDDLTTHALDEDAHPVVQFLNALIHDALQDGASDIHLECTPQGGMAKFRIDGVMLPVRPVESRAMMEQMVSRLKVMAELDIGERRLPQDGRFRMRMSTRPVDFRLSIMPSSHGEDAVVRVLDKSRIQMGGSLSLDALGFDSGIRADIRRLAGVAHGMLLVTGPTGSGKTTTLYATLSEIQTGHEKVITIEDPVEYRLDGIVQIPVNERKGLSFARGLRSILRHDPDRIMVGEIRDPETAQIAVQAALTGHLVFSTVHANSVLDVVGRFMHMGLDLYHVVSALNGVVAQRLLRRVCAQCAGEDAPTPEQLSRLGWQGPTDMLRRGRGCPACRGTGYQGRQAYAELMRMDDELRDLIASRAPMTAIKRAARDKGMVPLRQAAMAGLRRGATSVEDVLRVTLDDE